MTWITNDLSSKFTLHKSNDLACLVLVLMGVGDDMYSSAEDKL